MAAVTIPNAGTYDLLVDVGFLIDGFTLDDPVKGLLNSPDYVLDGTTSFASVADGTTTLNVRRGRQDPDDQFTAGTMTFVLNDTLADGVFNPFDDDPSNPYYDQAQGVPGLAPGRQVKLVRYQLGELEPNLVTNPSFETNLDGWEAVSSNYPITRTTTTSYQGTASMLTTHNVTTAMTTTQGSRIDNTATYRIPVIPGTSYVATGYVRNVSGSRTIQMRARTFTTATGTSVSQSVISNTTAAGSWQKVTATITPGTSQLWMDVIFQTTGAGAIGDSFATDNVTIKEISTLPESLFVGYIVNYDYKFTLGGLDTVTVLCADNLYRLASTGIEAQNPTKEFTGDRINFVLDLPEVDYPTGAARDIAAGTVELGGGGNYAIDQGTNVLAYFNQITATAERGRIFVDREGVLVSQNRIGNTLSGPVAIFSDQGTEIPYNDLKIDFKADEIINLVEISTRGSHVGSASDPSSQATYFVKSLFVTNSLLESNTAAQDLADYLLNPEPEPRFTAVQTFFGSLTSGQRDTVAILDIGDTVLIEKDIVIGGSPTLRGEELAIEGIEHRLVMDTGHTTRVFTSPTTIVTLLILNDLNDGILDTNVLG